MISADSISNFLSRGVRKRDPRYLEISFSLIYIYFFSTNYPYILTGKFLEISNERETEAIS